MATNNFLYENRCVVVTDMDYEMDNVPDTIECIDQNRNYPSYLIQEFDFWEVVLTRGYYEGACIDYQEHHYKTLDDVIVDYIGYPNTQEELFHECRRAFGLSERKMRKICGNVSGMNISHYIDNAIEKVGEYLAEQEEVKVNKFIDGLKQLYGYEEYKCFAVASNGEAFYERI